MNAQDRFNERMNTKKQRADSLRPLMNGLAKSIKTLREEMPTAKRVYK